MFITINKKMIENLKARFKAQKYNIWTEQIDPKRKADGWFNGVWYANGKLRIMKLKQVKTITDIKQGDTLIWTGDTLKNEPVKAQIVKVTPNDGTEIIFDKKMNRFFNLGMYLEGKSWVKDVRVVI